LYRSILERNPRYAPIVAEIATEAKAMGAAWFSGSPSPEMSNGTERIPPPDPVSPISKPTDKPSMAGIRIFICIVYIIH